MSSASKRQDDDADRTSVPPYPAEIAATWQAFRVTLRDTDADDLEGGVVDGDDGLLEGSDEPAEPSREPS